MIADHPQLLPLWPEREPFTPATPEKIEIRGTNPPDSRVGNVQRPTITVYLPPESKNTGAAVVICPGGGYGGLAIDKEGHNVATWLNTMGIAGIVLKYRMPQPAQTKRGEKPWPVQDAHRAMRLVRSRAGDWKIDPHRIGMMGFSAGGHLASTIATHFENKEDRPDFTILIYPVISMKDPIGHAASRDNLLGKDADPAMVELYSTELHVTAQTPPAYLAHAKDDDVKIENSRLYADALQKAGVPCHLETFEQGGHGFGMGVRGGEPATWPDKCVKWLEMMGLLKISR